MFPIKVFCVCSSPSHQICTMSFVLQEAKLFQEFSFDLFHFLSFFLFCRGSKKSLLVVGVSGPMSLYDLESGYGNFAKKTLSTSSLIMPMYQMRVTIKKSVFPPKRILIEHISL